jgi:PAS domain S-box-containing protein
LIDVENLYRALVEGSDDAIVAKDLNALVCGWNPAAERLFGYRAEEMIGNSIRRLLPPDRQDEEDAILARIRSGERVGQFFTKRLHKSGRLLDVSVTVSPVRDAQGAIVGASKIARDAGPLLEAQRRLRESERSFRMMADNISQLAWIARGDGHILWYNKRWYDYTGSTQEEMEGWGWKKVHHPDYLEGVTDRWRASLARGEEWEDTFPLRDHQGEYRWFLSRAKPIRDGGNKVEYWFGTNTDVTEQREQAEQIRLLLMEVNHRSKNLLATVQALARRTARGENGAVESEFIARFEDRIHSLALNQDILIKREWSQVPLRELAEAQLAFANAAPGEFTIHGPDLSLTPRAAETLGMALHELATNALKYGALSVSGGRVDIGWSVEERPQSQDHTCTSRFTLWWRESGGPPVAERGRVGFGSTLINNVPKQSLRGEVDLHFKREGVCWEVRCPLCAVSRGLADG